MQLGLRLDILYNESCSERPYCYRAVNLFFDLGSPRLVCLSPKGGMQMKSCSDHKILLTKSDRSTHITVEKGPQFSDFGNLEAV